MRTQCCQPVFGSPQCNDCPLTVPLYPIYRQPAPSQTGTPRTDALLGEIWSSPPQPDYYVPPKMIEHARQLERELAEAKGSLSRARAGETLLRKAADTAELALSQAKRDAERYRFLRSEAVCTEPRYYEFWNRFLESKLVREESMDKLIDAEMNAALAKREGEGKL